MPLTRLQADFEILRRARRADPEGAVRGIGGFAAESLRILETHCESKDIAFKGAGAKWYGVFVVPGTERPFSRPFNRELFVPSPEEFAALWNRYTEALLDGVRSGAGLITSLPREEIDRAFYTVVIGYAAAIDLFSRGNRAGPGTLFEMAVGPAVSLLTGREEAGDVRLTMPDSDATETVKTDLSFVGREGEPILVVPTKITTRERIVQAFVHQRILDAARPGIYRSVLCIGSENNVACPRGAAEWGKTYDNCWLQDTLVPGTIALYENYVAPLSGLYYLDPPAPYLSGAYGGLPPVKHFGTLLTEDLPLLLAPKD